MRFASGLPSIFCRFFLDRWKLLIIYAIFRSLLLLSLLFYLALVVVIVSVLLLISVIVADDFKQQQQQQQQQQRNSCPRVAEYVPHCFAGLFWLVL